MATLCIKLLPHDKGANLLKNTRRIVLEFINKRFRGQFTNEQIAWLFSAKDIQRSLATATEEENIILLFNAAITTSH